MSDKTKLIFKKGASRPSTNVEIGTIFFNTTTRLIDVYATANTWQSFGSKIADAGIDSTNPDKLIITKADGSQIAVDHSVFVNKATYEAKVTELSNGISGAQNTAKAASTAAANEAARAQAAEMALGNDITSHIRAYNSKIAELDSTDTALSGRVGTLESKVANFGTPLRFRGVSANAPTEGLKEGDFYITTTGIEYIYAKTGENSTFEWQKIGDTTTQDTAITELDRKVTALANLVGTTTVSSQISTAINNLDANATSTDGKNIQVKVTQANGKITAVNITTDNTAKESALTALAERVSTVEAAIVWESFA